jgi:hypothetical protein
MVAAPSEVRSEVEMKLERVARVRDELALVADELEGTRPPQNCSSSCCQDVSLVGRASVERGHCVAELASRHSRWDSTASCGTGCCQFGSQEEVEVASVAAVAVDHRLGSSSNDSAPYLRAPLRPCSASILVDWRLSILAR